MKEIALLICLLIPLSFFSQNTTLTRKTVINGDTVVLISPYQLSCANVCIVALEGCNDIVDSLDKKIHKQGVSIIHYQEFKEEAVKEIEVKTEIINNQASQVGGLLEKDKRNTKKIKWLKLQRNVFTVSTAVLLAVVILVF